MANLRTALRLLKIYAKMDLTWFLRDTKYCLAQIFSDIVISLTSVAGMYLLATRLGGFAGFSRPEVLFLLGFSQLVAGTHMLLLGNNNASHISRIIGRGQLDHMLLQPVPLPLQFLCWGIAPVSAGGGFLCGVALTIAALVQLPLAPSPPWVLLFLALLLCAVAVMTAFIYIVSSLAFIAPYAAEEIAMEATDVFYTLAPYPLGGLGRLAQVVLCGVIPVGATAWLPAAALLGKGGYAAVPYLLFALAAGFVLLATLIFRKGMKHYAKYSCPRYSGLGRN